MLPQDVEQRRGLGRMLLDEEDYVASSEVLSYYYLSRLVAPKRLRGSSSASSWTGTVVDASHIDKIDIRPGQLDVCKMHRDAPAWAKRYLAIVLPAADASHVRPLLRDAADRDRQLQRKGTPRVLLSPGMMDVMTHLASPECNLLEHRPGVGRPRGALSAWSNCFLVDKSSTFVDGHGVEHFWKRVIWDARVPNAVLLPLVGMELFSLDALFDVFGRLAASAAQYFCVMADLRHYFHQIPLPERWRQLFRVYYDFTEAGRRRQGCFEPTTTPMGWQSVPPIGQTATWTLILSGLDRADKQEARAALGLGEDLPRVMPPWLPLNDGGGIFVIIDNIFVVTQVEAVALAWKGRLVAQAARYGAIFKPDKDGPTAGETVHLRTLIRGDVETTVIFTGIELAHGGRRPHGGIPTALVPQLRWEGSYVALISILGKVLWCRRTRGARMLDPEYEDLWNLYRLAVPTEGKSWDDIIELDLQSTAVLRRFVHQARSPEFTPFDAPLADMLSAAPLNAAFLVVDASLSEPCEALPGGYSGIGLLGAWEKQPRAIVFEAIERHAQKKIALAELEAICRGVERLKAEWARTESSSGQLDLIVVATDSSAARGMAQRMWSRDDGARQLLRRLDLALGRTRCFYVYVPSQENAADRLSRGLRAQGHIWEQTLVYLQGAWALARASLATRGRRQDGTRLERRSGALPQESAVVRQGGGGMPLRRVRYENDEAERR